MNTNENATFNQSFEEQQNPPTVETTSTTTTYYYAVLDDNDIVTEVISSPFPAPEGYTQYIEIDSLDETLVGKYYNRDTGEFETVPDVTCDTVNVTYNGTSKRLNTKLDEMDAFAESIAQDVANMADSMHTHENQTVLDGITAAKVSQWDAAASGSGGSTGSEMSAADILTKLKTVDGANSGLDADTLDGMQASEFATASQLEGKANATHSHAMSDVTGLSSALAGKAEADHTHTGYAASNHTHDGYATADHTHSGYAASSHNHSMSDITGLSNALAGKSDTDHTHSGYAASNHNHAGTYAPYSHSHSGYASSDHTHSGYASSGHTHSEYFSKNGGAINFACKQPAGNFRQRFHDDSEHEQQTDDDRRKPGIQQDKYYCFFR